MTTCTQSWKKLLVSACLLSSLTLSPTTATAELIAYDGFTYSRHQWTEGSAAAQGIQGLDGGFGWAGPWQETTQYLTGIAAEARDLNDDDGLPAGARTRSLSYTDSQGRRLITTPGQARTSTSNSSHAIRPLTRSLGEPGETIWVSFLAQAGLDNASAWSFFKLRSVATGGDGNYFIRLGKVNPATTANWAYQINGRVNGVDIVSPHPWKANGPSLVEQTFYLLKIEYPLDPAQNLQLSLWYNPDLGGEEELGEPDTFEAPNQKINFAGIRGRVSIDFDEIRIGTTFASVTPHGTFAEDLRIENASAMSVRFETEAGKEYFVLQKNGEIWDRLSSNPVSGDGQVRQLGFPAIADKESLRIVERSSENRSPNPAAEPVLPSIPGLALHMDASATDSLTLNGPFVEEWRDAQGRDIVFTPTVFPPEEPETELRPVFGPLGPNGRNTLLFDKDSLDTRSPAGLALANDIEGITFFSVVMNNYDAAQNIFRMSLVASDTGVRFVQFRTATQPGINVRRADTGTLHHLYGGERHPGEWEIDSSLTDFDTAQAFLFQNGMETAYDGAVQTPGRTDSTDSRFVRIGSSTNPNTLANAWQGGIAEILFFNRALSQEERNQVGIYLSDKYNLPYQVSQEKDVAFDLLDSVTLSFRADAGVEYSIEATNDLTSSWTDTGFRVTGVGFKERTFATITHGADKQFFRARKLTD